MKFYVVLNCKVHLGNGRKELYNFIVEIYSVVQIVIQKSKYIHLINP